MSTSATVSHDVLLRCATPSGRRTTLAATLAYAELDPYAVRVVFRSPHDDVAWLVDRELLVAGLEGLAGEGDVRVLPSAAGMVELRFDSPAGSLVALLPWSDLDLFLSRTLDVVPLGEERIDADELLLALLASGTE